VKVFFLAIIILNQLLGMIFIAGITIAVFIEILLLSKKNKSKADKILMFWMFLMAIHLFLFYLSFTEGIYEYPYLLGIDFPLPLLHGVLLYFYVSSMTGQLPKSKGLLALHLIPSLASYLYLASFFMRPAIEKIEVFKNQGAGYEGFMLVLSISISLSGVLYVIWSNVLLGRHKRNILNQFSDIQKVDLKWLQLLTWGMGGIWIIVIFSERGLAIFLALIVFIFLIAFFGIRQGTIVTVVDPFKAEEDKRSIIKKVKTADKEIAAADSSKVKYAKSGLNAVASAKLYSELLGLMNDEMMYQKAELSIGELADRLAVHPNYLSQIINERKGKNFYEFVNAYRIEEFKRLVAIPENQKLTLLSLAYDCGFNSKSSFNRYFKKASGQTPSQYFTSIIKQ